MNFALIIFFILFGLLAYKNFRLALGVFIILLPTYLVRFQVGPFPSTMLELAFFDLFLVWLIKYARQDRSKIISLIKSNKWLFALITIFLISSIIAVLVSGDYMPALGIWRAYFLEPILLFIILLSHQKMFNLQNLSQWLVLSSVPITIYAIMQKVFNFGLDENGRVLSFFTSPNAVTLFLLPLVFLNIFLLWQNKKFASKYLYIVILILSLVVIFLTKSQGGWIGLGAGLVAGLFFVGYRKIAIGLVVAGLLISFLLPNMRSAVMFQDQGSKNRLILWEQSGVYLTQSPYNFIFGAGLRQFYDKIQKPTHDWSVIYRQIYPHNIFLNFWTEIGLLGSLSFIFILIYLFVYSFKVKRKNILIGSVSISLLVAVVVHGLVDVPYFKNDLAFLWWILTFLIISQHYKLNKSNVDL